MRIGVDLDGVCYHWSDTARFLLAHHHGYQLGESTSWDYIQDNIEPKDWKWLWKEGVEHGLFRHGHLYKGTAEALPILNRLGHVAIITHRPESARQDTVDWLSFHKLPFHELHLLTGSEPKSSVQPQCDVYVDDSPAVAEDLRVHTSAAVLLVDRPWNREVTNDNRVIRVDGWLGVIREVRRLKIIEMPERAA